MQRVGVKLPPVFNYISKQFVHVEILHMVTLKRSQKKWTWSHMTINIVKASRSIDVQ